MKSSTSRSLFPALIAALTLGFGVALAQPGGPDGRVTVSGVGEIRIAPDMALLSVEASNNSGSPLSASNSTRKDMNQILSAARKIVKDSIRDVRTTRISVNPEYEWVEGKRKFRGFVASQTLEITLYDVGRVEALLEAVMDAPVYTVGNLEFRHTKADSLYRAASILAMRNSADNARTLCTAAKRSCDELLSVRTAGTSGPGPMPMGEFKMMRADASGGMPVQPGTLVFSTSVEADYRLKREGKEPRDGEPAAEKAPPAPEQPKAE